MKSNLSAIEELRLEITKKDAQIEMLMRLINDRPATNSGNSNVAVISTAELLFRRLTLKQNAALQVILSGGGNKTIANILKCSDSTAKVHVRGAMKHLDVNTRSQTFIKAKPLFDALSESAYEELTGLTKNWNENPDSHDITEVLRNKTK